MQEIRLKFTGIAGTTANFVKPLPTAALFRQEWIWLAYDILRYAEQADGPVTISINFRPAAGDSEATE